MAAILWGFHSPSLTTPHFPYVSSSTACTQSLAAVQLQYEHDVDIWDGIIITKPVLSESKGVLFALSLQVRLVLPQVSQVFVNGGQLACEMVG